MKRFLEEAGRIWCIHMHTGVMWPFRGRYRCRTCLREYPVPFEPRRETQSDARPRVNMVLNGGTLVTSLPEPCCGR